MLTENKFLNKILLKHEWFKYIFGPMLTIEMIYQDKFGKKIILFFLSLSALVCIATIILKTSITLGDAANLGLLGVAVLALKFAREQAMEWRRKECTSLLSSVAENIDQFDETLPILIMNCNGQPIETLALLSGKIDGRYHCDEPLEPAINKATIELSLIEVHFRKLRIKNDISDVIILLNLLVPLSKMIKSHNESGPFEGNNLEQFEANQSKINEAATVLLKKGHFSKFMLTPYIDELRKDCL